MRDIKSFVKTRTKMNTEPATSTAPDLSNAVLSDVILSVGRKLWLIPRSYGRNKEETPIEVTITKVGQLRQTQHC